MLCSPLQAPQPLCPSQDMAFQVRGHPQGILGNPGVGVPGRQPPHPPMTCLHSVWF